MAYTKNAAVDAMDTASQLNYYKNNPAEAQQEIQRAQGVGGSAAQNWTNQLQQALQSQSSPTPAPTTTAPVYTPTSSYTSSAPNYSTPSTPSYSTPATSYTGSSNIIGNVSGSQDLGKSYQDILNANRTGDQQFKQLNTWADDKGNVYDTTNMSAQQSYALMLAKSGNQNAAAILKGMGLDMNGNSTSPTSGAVWGKPDANGNYGGYNGSTPTSTPTSGGTWGKADSNGNYGGYNGGSSNGTDSQKSAQDWINNSASGQGGLTAYVKQQNDRYQQALASGDTSLASKLQADAQRVGYSLGSGSGLQNTGSNSNQSFTTGQNNMPSGWQGSNQGFNQTGYSGSPAPQTQSNADLINSIYNNNYASQLQKLKESRDQSLAGLAGQEGVINQNTTNNLNNNDATSHQRMLALKEAMANQGLSSSGDNISAQIGIGNSQQQVANDINNNKTNQLATLLAQRNVINNNASASDLALMQQLQGTRDNQLLANSNTAQDRAIQLAQLLGSYNGQQTLASQNQQFNQGISQAGLTGQYNGQQTQQAQNQLFNQGATTAGLTGYYDPAASVRQQMAINSAAYGSASPEQQKILHDKNLELAASIGGTYDPNTGNYTFPQAQRTLAGQQADQSAKYQEGQLGISQQNADTQRAAEQANSKWREAEAARQYALANGQIGNARQSNNNYAMQNLMNIWEKTGVAPDGIPGVKAGTPLYDKTGARQDEQLQNKQDQLDLKHFSSERDQMISAVRGNKVNVNDAMSQINQDEQMGIYTADLAEKLRTTLRVLAGTTPIPNDPKNNIQLNLGGLLKPNGGGSSSVTQNVFGG